MPTRRRLLIAAGGAAGGAAAYYLWPRPAPSQPAPPPTPHCLYQSSVPGGAAAAPVVAADTIYLAAYHGHGFRYFGGVHALSRDTGRERWSFTDDQGMLPTASAPQLAGGRLFVGEGMHSHFHCRLFALDPATGRKLWAADADDHVESGAAVAGSRVVFGCGNDGVRAVEADTGRRVWQFNPDIHVDTTPTVADGRVFVGSGPSRRFKTLGVFALDADTGRMLWRSPTDLPAWGGSAVGGGSLFVGLGNGRLTVGDRNPAGALLALDAATGAERWLVRTADAVFQRPVVAGDAVFLGSRDGTLHAVGFDGNVRWQVPAGGPVVSAVAVVGNMLYAVTTAGRVSARSVIDGKETWGVSLTPAETEVTVFAPVTVADGFVYVAGTLRQAELGYPVLFRVPVG